MRSGLVQTELRGGGMRVHAQALLGLALLLLGAAAARWAAERIPVGGNAIHQ